MDEFWKYMIDKYTVKVEYDENEFYCRTPPPSPSEYD